jgi:hypothetical protein
MSSPGKVARASGGVVEEGGEVTAVEGAAVMTDAEEEDAHSRGSLRS